MMKKTFMAIALMATTMTLVTSCKQQAKTNETAAVEATEAAAPEAQEAEAADLVPDFELHDLQGNPLKLSSLRGKYVVLDFWGSWCVWCIRGVPKMKEAYAKHKDKMEILGVDCHDTEENWRAAVDQLQMPWLQVRCPDEKVQAIKEMYNVEGFPTKVIIDPEGKLVKVVVGEDPAFYPFLDELFAKK